MRLRISPRLLFWFSTDGKVHLSDENPEVEVDIETLDEITQREIRAAIVTKKISEAGGVQTPPAFAVPVETLLAQEASELLKLSVVHLKEKLKEFKRADSTFSLLEAAISLEKEGTNKTGKKRDTVVQLLQTTYTKLLNEEQLIDYELSSMDRLHEQHRNNQDAHAVETSLRMLKERVG